VEEGKGGEGVREVDESAGVGDKDLEGGEGREEGREGRGREEVAFDVQFGESRAGGDGRGDFCQVAVTARENVSENRRGSEDRRTRDPRRRVQR
jgi:hypothetical protein